VNDPPVPVGFYYAQALLDLRNRLTYAQISERLGYDGASSISDIINKGVIPSHIRGEALFVLYVEIFGHKPPMSPAQASGQFVGNSAPHITA